MMISNSKFLITKEYLKFTEFCGICKEYNYIGLCYGTPGVGKTLSARYYSHWDTIETILPPEHLINPLPIDEISVCDSIFYTVPVTSSPSKIEKEITDLCINLNCLIGDIILPKKRRKGSWDKQINYTKLIIIDEADRLRPVSLEQIRDIYDKGNIAIILIGMPGIEKKLSRFPQLYSRIGFVHNFKPVNSKEIENVIRSKLEEFNIEYDSKYIAYLRVSTNKQDLNNQKLEVLDYAHKNNIKVTNFVEVQSSSKKSSKERMLDILFSELNEGDTLIVSELSRIARSLGNIIQIIDELIKNKIKLITIKENIILNPENHDIQTKVMITLFGLFSEIERDLISERTKQGLQAVKAAGKVLGRPKGKLGTSILDGKEVQIQEYLNKKVTKSSIAKIFGVSRTCLYSFIESRNLN